MNGEKAANKVQLIRPSGAKAAKTFQSVRVRDGDTKSDRKGDRFIFP